MSFFWSNQTSNVTRMKGQAMRAVTKTFDLYAVLHGDDIVSQWYPTQDQALFEAYSLGLVRRNKQTDQPYFPVDVRVVSFETLREFENARCVDTGMRWLKDNSHGTIARNKG